MINVKVQAALSEALIVIPAELLREPSTFKPVVQEQGGQQCSAVTGVAAAALLGLHARDSGVVWYGVVWCGGVVCGVVWCDMVWYGMVDVL